MKTPTSCIVDLRPPKRAVSSHTVLDVTQVEAKVSRPNISNLHTRWVSSEVVSSHAVFEAYVHLQMRVLCFDAMNTHDLGFF